MQSEKRSNVSSSASSRWLLIGVGTGVLLAVVGFGILKAKPQAVSSTPSPPAPASTIIISSPTPSASSKPTPIPTPTATPISVAEARAAYAAKDYPKAITLLSQAVKEAQGAVAIAELQYELGNAYRENKNTDLALSTYALAMAQNPKMVIAYQARANILLSLSRKDEAKQTLQAGIDANPGNHDLERDLSVVDLSGPSN